ncbi:MAG: Cof-type HAD-IIB family hydrolase [Acidimicrobiales bacterium]
MDVRLIATDLDGTLFGADHRPAPPTVEAVNAAVEAGIVVVAATGRSWFRGLELATSTGARLHQFIGSNGGHRMNVATRTLEERLAFEEHVVHEIIDSVSAALGNVGFGFELADGMTWTERFVELTPVSLDGDRRPASPTPLGRLHEVGKMFVAHPDVSDVDLVRLVDPLVPAEANVTTSGVPFIELTPPGADKGAAVARFADTLGIEAEHVLAFGDNQNDLSLLRWAGHAVAMGNALDMVKGVADEVTGTNLEFGVANVINRVVTG